MAAGHWKGGGLTSASCFQAAPASPVRAEPLFCICSVRSMWRTIAKNCGQEVEDYLQAAGGPTSQAPGQGKSSRRGTGDSQDKEKKKSKEG